jgi:carbamate kinase
VKGRVVISLGGNAILGYGRVGTYSEQLSNVRAACEQVAEIVCQGYEVVLTHGNGPQVGSILRQNELSANKVPPLPLDACGAESQGLIGYMIQQSLANSLHKRGIDKTVVTVVSQVIVESDDPAFAKPSKPIGEFMEEHQAKRLSERLDVTVVKEAGKGWRRVVSSPSPGMIAEAAAVERLISGGCIPIACGGGGVPTLRDRSGNLAGVEAVVDKDLTSQLLATEVRADILLILVDVDGVYLKYGTPEAKLLREMSMTQAEYFLSKGEFAQGSMAPKVEASLRFLRSGGKSVRVGHLNKAVDVLSGNSGTVIYP